MRRDADDRTEGPGKGGGAAVAHLHGNVDDAVAGGKQHLLRLLDAHHFQIIAGRASCLFLEPAGVIGHIVVLYGRQPGDVDIRSVILLQILERGQPVLLHKFIVEIIKETKGESSNK